MPSLARGNLRCIAVLMLSWPATLAAQQIAIGEYAIPTAGGYPELIAAGPDGALWFTEYYGNKIGRITTAGVITEYPVPTANSGPNGITAGPDGALWFTEGTSSKIGRITAAGLITEYTLPTANAAPVEITAGPDGALWFTEYKGNRIGRISTAGRIRTYLVPTARSGPLGIAPGPDGALWFTENAVLASKIGRLTTAGQFTEYPTPTGRSSPYEIAAGSDGAMWFTEEGADKIGRITTAGAIAEYPESAGLLFGITPGPNGSLWFTVANSVGQITTAGVVTTYPTPTAYSNPLSITTGPDGELWFTEARVNKIGELVFVTAGLSVSPTSGTYQQNLTFTGSTFTPGEKVKIYLGGVGSGVLSTAMADSSGSFTAAALAPQSPYGPRLFLGVGQTSKKLGAASFSVIPLLIPSPNAGPVGSPVTGPGYGFGPLEQVQIYWSNPATSLGTATANVHGTFNGTAALTFTVPTGAPLGVNQFYGVGQTTGATGYGSFTVE